MTGERNYWRCEYENLRRKKNKEITKIKNNQVKFMNITFDLLKSLGMKEEEILKYYEFKQSTR